MMLTGSLNQERQHIAKHEDLGQPGYSNDGVLLRLKNSNDAAQYHVDRRGKQGRCEKEQEGLGDERSIFPVRCLAGADSSRQVPKHFDYEERLDGKVQRAS